MFTWKGLTTIYEEEKRKGFLHFLYLRRCGRCNFMSSNKARRRNAPLRLAGDAEILGEAWFIAVSHRLCYTKQYCKNREERGKEMKARKWIGALLAVVLAVQMTACAMPAMRWDSSWSSQEESSPAEGSSQLSSTVESLPPSEEGYSRIEKEDWSALSPYGYLEQDSSYGGLWLPAQKDCYDQLKEAAYWVSVHPEEGESWYPLREIVVEGILAPEEIRAAVTAFKDDQPQVFWIAATYTYAHQQDNKTWIQFRSLIPPEECQRRLGELEQAVRECAATLSEGMTQYQREKAVYDFVANRCTYDMEAFADQENWEQWWEAFTAYGALVQGKSVCEGYARAVELLLSLADMDCALIRGGAEGERHMWNVVQVDGEWYHLDPTGNDNSDQGNYFYFNLNDQQIQSDHQIDPPVSQIPEERWQEETEEPLFYNLFLPDCPSTEANYFRQEAFVLDSLEEEADQKAVEAISQAWSRGEQKFSIWIGESLDYTATLNQLFQEEPYKFFYYIDKVNAALPPEERLNSTDVRYVDLPDQRAVVIYLTK